MKIHEDYTGKTVRITSLFIVDEGEIEVGQTFNVLRMGVAGDDMIVTVDGKDWTLSLSQVEIVEEKTFDGWSTP